MKKLLCAVVVLLGLLFVSNVYAYNPNSFEDEETLTIQGNRPKVDIELSEIVVTVEPEDFVDGKAEAKVEISNEGNVPCHLELELQNVPVDLEVEANVEDDFLLKGETTTLYIVIALTEQQDTESFQFSVLVKAHLKP